MKVFVTGATGVLGRRVLPQLVQAGHSVTGVARSAGKAALVRDLGALPAHVDLFDPVAVRAAVDGHDVVANLATKIPPPSRAVLTSAWAQNDRLRREASRNLVNASLETGVTRFVQESIAFVYPDSGDRWVDEDVPLDPPALGRASQAAEAEASRFTKAGRVGVVLRFGQFYAADAAHTMYMRRMACRRLPPLPGPRSAYAPAIAAQDAAAGVVAALDAPAGAWNVTDDEPLTRQAFNLAVAQALGVEPPHGTGSLLLRLSGNTRFYLRSLRVSNRRFKAATGWSPRYPDAATGWQAMVTETPAFR
ncbi:MAG TPA: NAD(P)-dependent oxidoreductase [Micromonosporaceae bacterium]|nr:NAD(P)-dependent oxidoreductase [Micromonosporaceae bacterium]